VIEFAVYEHVPHADQLKQAEVASFAGVPIPRVWIARDNLDGEVLIQSRYLEPVLDMVRRYQSEVVIYLAEPPRA
jgi:hypothetical protein